MIKVVYAASWFARRRFYSFSHRLYRENKNWSEPAVWGGRRVLSARYNSLLRYPHALLMAVDGRKIVARVLTGAIGEKGYFALFDAEEDEQAVKLLMDEVIAWQRSRKIGEIVGPIAPGEIDLGGGVLAEGFGEPAALNDVYNMAYYGQILERCGFTIFSERLTYRIERAEFEEARYHRIAEWAKKRFGYAIKYDFSKKPRELAEAVCAIMGDSGETEEMNRLIGAIYRYLAPEMSPIVYKDDRPVGVLLTMRQNGGRARATTLWVSDAWRGRGVQAALFSAAAEAMEGLEAESIDASWIASENQASRMSIENAGGRIIRRYRLYVKQV